MFITNGVSADAHTHFSWNNSGSLDGLADLGTEEHTLFSMRSARTFLDCGYTSCLGAASAKQRLDLVIRNAIQDGSIPGPRFLANGKEMAPNDGACDMLLYAEFRGSDSRYNSIH